MAAMRIMMIFLMILPQLVFSQSVMVTDTLGNSYSGEIHKETDSSICIKTKTENILCFESASISSVKPFKKRLLSIPLTAHLNPYFYTHDLGVHHRFSDVPTMMYRFGMQKRITDHYAVGGRAIVGVGEIFEIGLQAIGTYQFNPFDQRVNTLSFIGGWNKDLVYWSEKGFDFELEYALLLRKDRFKSHRLFVSFGMHSSKIIYSKTIDYSDSKLQRFTTLQMKLGYGWQF